MDDDQKFAAPRPGDDLAAAAHPAGWPYGDTGPAAPVRRRSGVRLALGLFAALAVWGAVASAHNAGNGGDGLVSPIGQTGGTSVPLTPGASGSAGNIPLGPIGEASCRSAVAEARSHIPDAVAEAQNGVDDLIAEHPELAAYAADAKRMLAQSAPQAQQSLTDAGHQLGC
jgi:hypothetical protein